MNYVGISCGFHDAALSIIDDSGNILYAGHSERYSGIKHDKNLCRSLLSDALSYSTAEHSVHYYERPLLKYLRQLRSGEQCSLLNISAARICGHEHVHMLGTSKIHTHNHHLSHAAAGFQTSPYERATVVIIDAIGEFDTISIWGAQYINGVAKYTRLWRQTYPDSIGLFYSALTKRVGLKPLDEEYILMGMAGWGKPVAAQELQQYSVKDINSLTFNHNHHLGVEHPVLEKYVDVDIAASTQQITEVLIDAVMSRAASYGWSENLVYGGGVALNCTANRLLGNHFDNIWILPNPGDAGSSLGAAALGYRRKLNWTTPYLGYNIDTPYPVQDIVNELLTNSIVGVANGRAEWGPRALGNRSLLADPRGQYIKDQVNDIKRRQKFRPFAPVILEEHVNDYFEMPPRWSTSPYMQVVARCNLPQQYPAIVHIDGTSRVQTVPKNGSGIRTLLEEWYRITGCPMLLNTSLNIRGEPMVNDIADARRFSKTYDVKVCT